MKRGARVSPTKSPQRSPQRSPASRSRKAHSPGHPSTSRGGPATGGAGTGLAAPDGDAERSTKVKGPKLSSEELRMRAYKDAGALSAKMFAKRQAREQQVKELSNKDKKDSVGDWLFGQGGLKGLSMSQQQEMKERKKKRTVDPGGTGVATGMAINVATSNPKSGGGRAGGEPTRLDFVMAKYQRRTEAAVKKREAKAGKDMHKGARPMREKAPQSLKADAVECCTSCFRKIMKCVSACWNGPTYDEKAELEKQPIILGGIYRKTAETLGISQPQLRKFRNCFKRIDTGDLGDISLIEFFEFIDEPMSVFGTRVYEQVIESQIGKNPDCVLNFDNFFLFVVTFGLLNKKDVLKFIFDTFDADGSGFLDEEEFAVLIQVINKEKPLFPGSFSKILVDFDTDGDGRISLNEFAQFNKTFPIGLFPIFRLHDKVRRCTIGEVEFQKLELSAGQLRRKTAQRKVAQKRRKK